MSRGKQCSILVTHRLEVYHLAKLNGKVVRFHHRETQWWVAHLCQKQRNWSELNSWLPALLIGIQQVSREQLQQAILISFSLTENPSGLPRFDQEKFEGNWCVQCELIYLISAFCVNLVPRIHSFDYYRIWSMASFLLEICKFQMKFWHL